MHIVLLSEHGEPLIGGATHLSKKIAEILSEEGHKITFVVPNSGSNLTTENNIKENFTLVKVKAFVPIDNRFEFRGEKRKQYAIAVSDYIKELEEREPIQVIQILSGMYLMRHIDVPYFKRLGIKTVAGLLNVPPEECGLSWKGDNVVYYLKDAIRKFLIGIINKNRIKYQKYDAYTVESLHVKKALSNIISPSLITYIPLGTDESKVEINKKDKGQKLRILTVGGINPSKNQHVIPSIALQLQNCGKEFEWNIIGPDRNSKYTQFLLREIEKKGVGKNVNLILGLPKDQLMQYYRTANLYVQTSIEEGFCMTALDAVVFGLPLIGIDTGAIMEFIEKGKGVVVKNSQRSFVSAIIKVIENPEDFRYSNDDIIPLIEFYNWKRIGELYISLYESLI